MASKYMNEKYRYAFGQFAGLILPEFVEEFGGFMKTVFHELDDVRNLPQGKDLLGAFDFLLDGKLSGGEIRLAWRGAGAVYMIDPPEALREFLEACRTYLITGKVESLHPHWQPGGLLYK
jgi:hypothetical protein